MNTETKVGLDADTLRQRRNLVLLSVGLIIFELSQGSIEKIPILGVGIILKDPDVVVYFAYLALLYFIWRFWVYSRPKLSVLFDEFEEVLSNQECYKKLIEPCLENFREESGIGRSYSTQKSGVEDQDRKQSIQEPLVESMKYRNFKATLIISIINPKGDYAISNKEYEVSSRSFLSCQAVTVMKVILNKKAFSDFVVPYLLAVGSFLLKVVNDINA